MMDYSTVGRADRAVLVIFVCAILLLLPAYYIFYQAQAFGLYHDDGVYLVTAKSLAENGTYSIESLPTPIPQTKYPILYPLILALLFKLDSGFPANLWLLKLSSLVFATIWFYLIYRYISRRYSRNLAFIVLTVVMASSWTLYLSASLLPDLLFSCLCLASAILMDRGCQKNQHYRDVLLAALLAGTAYLVNAKGVTIILGSLLFLLIRRKWKRMWMFGSVAAVTCVPWLIWQSLIPAPDNPILSYYSKLSYPAGHILGNYSFGEAAHVFVMNILYTGHGFIDLAGMHLPSPAIVIIFFIAIGFFSINGFWCSIRSRVTVFDLWFAVHVGMLLCWVWPPGRYLIPVLPIFLCYVGVSAHNLANRCSRFLKPKIVMGCILAGFIIPTYLTSYHAVAFSLDTGSVAITTGQDPDDWRAIKTLCGWIRQNTRPDAVIATNLDPVVYLLTGRKSIRAFKGDPYLLIYSTDPDRRPFGDDSNFRTFLLKYGVTHLMVTPMTLYSEAPYFLALVNRFKEKYPAVMRPVFTPNGFSSQILEIDRQELEKPGK